MRSGGGGGGRVVGSPAVLRQVGSDIAAIAPDVGGGAASVGGVPCVAQPSATGQAMGALAQDYVAGLERLESDMVASGRLVQAAGVLFGRVDGAVAPFYRATSGTLRAT